MYKSASWCDYMQSSYMTIERTIYRQLDAESIATATTASNGKKGERISRSGYIGPDYA